MRAWLSLLVFALLLAGFATAATTQQAPQGGPPAPRNLQVLPKDTPLPVVIAKMRVIAASLGVQCSFCHVQGNFASDAKDTKGIARRMLRMVDTINKDNFDGRAEVSCYTCHRGALKPVSQPPAPEAGKP